MNVLLLFYAQSNKTYLCASFQGAPGNRGFPGQDGLAGAKVGEMAFQQQSDFSILT